MFFYNHLGELIFLYQVGDVNGDGTLSTVDSTRILTEYVNSMAYPDYVMNYNLGQTLSYTYTYYTTTP